MNEADFGHSMMRKSWGMFGFLSVNGGKQ